jgi:large subunit ribosomal protein L21e
MTPYLRTVKVGDYVDIFANSSIHEGMPHKFYHGRTGIVYNVAKRAVGVEVNKVVRNRVEKKRVNIRIEHIRPSKCRKDFLDRVKRVDQTKRDAKEKGIKVPIGMLKRFPRAPKDGYIVTPEESAAPPMMRAPVPFDDML